MNAHPLLLLFLPPTFFFNLRSLAPAPKAERKACLRLSGRPHSLSKLKFTVLQVDGNGRRNSSLGKVGEPSIQNRHRDRHSFAIFWIVKLYNIYINKWGKKGCRSRYHRCAQSRPQQSRSRSAMSVSRPNTVSMSSSLRAVIMSRVLKVG